MPQKYEREIEELLNGLDNFLPDDPKGHRNEKPERPEKAERPEREPVELLEFRPRRPVAAPPPVAPAARRVLRSRQLWWARVSTHSLWVTVILFTVIFYALLRLGLAAFIPGFFRFVATFVLIVLFVYALYRSWRAEQIGILSSRSTQAWRSVDLNTDNRNGGTVQNRLQRWWRQLSNRKR